MTDKTSAKGRSDKPGSAKLDDARNQSAQIKTAQIKIAQIKIACDAVKRGGLIAYPTEAVYGLGCDPQNTQALERLVTLKGRAGHKGFIVIASNYDQLSDFIEPVPTALAKRLKQDWPGPVTWILTAAKQLPPLLTGNRPTLAVRVSDHPVVRQLCDILDHPLVSTSANLTGQKELRDAKSVSNIFGHDLDCIVDGQTGSLSGPTPIFDSISGKQLR